MANYKCTNDFKLTKFAFYERLNYRINALKNSSHTNFKNNNFSDLNLYGKVNTNFESIIINPNFLGTLDSGKTAANFVVAAFKSVKRHFQNAMSLERISLGEKFLSDIKCFSAYEDPIELYNNYIDEIMLTYNDTYLDRNKIKTFDDYITHLLQFVKKISPEFPITISSWMRSKRCPSFVSGLVLNVSNNDLGDDKLKEKDFINSTNFDFYVSTCKANGFYVSRNNPSVLIADIGSKQIEKFMQASIHNTGQRVLDMMYKEVYEEDMFFLKAKIIEHYSNLIENKSTLITPNISRNNKVYSKVYITDKSFNTNININTLYKLYINIKNIEEDKPYGQSDIDQFIEKAKKIEKLFDRYRALRYINKQFASLYTSKYGGLNYYKNKFQIMEDE